MTISITFIGAGNMASAIISGLCKNKVKAESITATSPDTDMLDNIQTRYGIQVSTDNLASVTQADVVVLAVKPQILKMVCQEIAPVLQARSKPPVVISIAAGIPLDSLQAWLGASIPVVRAMPNTPAMVGCGATALIANAFVTEEQIQWVESIHNSSGIVEWLDDESLMDAVTAIAGSAPAYFFLMFSAMEEAGVKQGLPKLVARRLAIQTALGSATMALQQGEEPEQLMRNVMSPQGSTERAIASFENDDFRKIIDTAMQACADRAKEMQSLFASK